MPSAIGRHKTPDGDGNFDRPPAYSQDDDQVLLTQTETVVTRTTTITTFLPTFLKRRPSSRHGEESRPNSSKNDHDKGGGPPFPSLLLNKALPTPPEGESTVPTRGAARMSPSLGTPQS